MTAQNWPPWAVKSLETGLDRLAKAVRDGSDRDVDEQIWLTRFLVIRTCGYVEQTVQECILAYVHARTGGPAQVFAKSWLTRSRTPSPSNLLDLVGRFDEAWKNELDAEFRKDDQWLMNELDMLVARRHQIAHGLNEGLGSRKALELVEVAKTVADWFILRFDPSLTSQRQGRNP